MISKIPIQTEAMTVRIPIYSRDDDQHYGIAAVYQGLLQFVRERHGLREERTLRKALDKILMTPRPNHYEHVRSVLEARINLEIQDTIHRLHDVANAYEPPVKPLARLRR